MWLSSARELRRRGLFQCLSGYPRASQFLLLALLQTSASLTIAAPSLPDIEDVFRNELACRLIEPLLADMAVAPVFRQEEGCVAVVPDEEPDIAYFTDDRCETPLPFEPTPLIEHCAALINPSFLGEGQGIGSPVWTLSPGSRFDVGARSLQGIVQPYLQRLIYRTIDTTAGTCSLEMRVYAADPSATGQQSLLALHGGSWSARGFGFFGLELTVPHFVEQGFVVYAPFYRLLGNSEGSAACHNASINDVLDDAQAALAWVEEHAVEFGSNAMPVVFGQSAGAHLATSLAVNHPDRVAAAVLFYPPTDFTDFTVRAQQGLYASEQGLGILERVLGVSLGQADINASPIPENSFPQQIVERDLSLPSIFLLHGMADDLVEPRQSLRLCDALARRELGQSSDSIAEIDLLRERRACGAGSSLQLVKEGRHALDICVADTLIATDLCLSGSDASRQEVSLAIEDAVNFARANSLSANDVTAQPSDVSTGSSSGWVQFPILALLLSASFIRWAYLSLPKRYR